MNISFLLTHIPNPRINKRINIFKSKGNVNVICIRRKSQDIWEPSIQDIQYYIFDIDLPAIRYLLKRYKLSKKYQRKTFKKLLELNPDIIYTESLDSLLVANRYKKHHNVKLFYEVADLREVYIEPAKNFFKRQIINIIKSIEKRCFKNLDCLVITSPKFYDLYYCNLISKDKVIYIPNIPNRDAFKNYYKKTEGKFTVGFIGGIRYLDQMKMLVNAAKKSDCIVLFAGAGGTSENYQRILEYCKDKEWVEFIGKYDYNKDIARLYGSVDCVYAVYDADNPNVRIALPNKLYEAVLCELPIIVAKNTYLSELVEKWHIGVPVSHTDENELTAALIELKNNSSLYNSFVEGCKNMTVEISLENYNKNLLSKID